jgi:tetratricopeptide (TPR) repeat protein
VLFRVCGSAVSAWTVPEQQWVRGELLAQNSTRNTPVQLGGRLLRKIKQTLAPSAPTPLDGRRVAGLPREWVRLAVDSARIPMSEGNWPEAIRQWSDILDRFGPRASWSAYRGLIAAHAASGRFGTAAAVATRARTLYPESVELEGEWANLPMLEGDWQTSIERWQALLERFGPDASWKAYVSTATCHEQLGDVAAALEVIERGRAHFPDSVEVAVSAAHIVLIGGNQAEAASAFESVIDRFGEATPWRVHLRLGVVYGRLGRLEDARRVLMEGSMRNPAEPGFAAQLAELAMAARDWPTAVTRWNDVLGNQLRFTEGDLGSWSFPRRGSDWDWFEEAWQAIAEDWDAIAGVLDFDPSPTLHRVLARSLEKAGLPEAALSILRRGLARHPDDSALAFDTVAEQLEAQHGEGGLADLGPVRQVLDGNPLMMHLFDALEASRSGLSHGPRSLSDVFATNLERLAEFAPQPAESSELGSLLVIRAPAGSSFELQMKSARYFDPDVIERRVRHVSERDAWPEMTSETNLMFERARRVSDEFGERFQDPPLLDAATLADAVMFFVFHELCLSEPMKRLAADIAAEADPGPVFIECPTDTFRYVDAYTFSQFDVLFLFFELRRLGVNAFLVRYYQGVPPIKPQVRFVPGVRALMPRGNLQPTRQAAHAQAVVPAGIRSVRRILETANGALVYTAGSVVKEYAYDRSLRQEFPIEPGASFHPSEDLLPSFEFDLWRAAALEVPPLQLGDGFDSQAFVEMSEALGGDWLAWLNRVLHDYLAGLSSKAFAEVASRGIREAHVCDHIFADSALFANAVKKSGGRVVLWPHSANPVHVRERRPETFDEVHAVTRSGADQWRSRFPDAVVHHSPRMMMDPPTRSALVDPRLPLSVVIIGGRSNLKHMPILDRTAHEASYRVFFEGLEELRGRHAINVYFKPRGHTGEHEMWLQQLVGNSGGWQRVLQHPLRLELPNMLFASISMGSSALLEGLSRGIPGLVVRDFPVRDYTTLDERAFPTGTAPEMLAVIESCLSEDGYETLLSRELTYYSSELEEIPTPL